MGGCLRLERNPNLPRLKTVFDDSDDSVFQVGERNPKPKVKKAAKKAAKKARIAKSAVKRNSTLAAANAGMRDSGRAGPPERVDPRLTAENLATLKEKRVTIDPRFTHHVETPPFSAENARDPDPPLLRGDVADKSPEPAPIDPSINEGDPDAVSAAAGVTKTKSLSRQNTPSAPAGPEVEEGVGEEKVDRIDVEGETGEADGDKGENALDKGENGVAEAAANGDAEARGSDTEAEVLAPAPDSEESEEAGAIAGKEEIDKQDGALSDVDRLPAEGRRKTVAKRKVKTVSSPSPKAKRQTERGTHAKSVPKRKAKTTKIA